MVSNQTEIHSNIIIKINHYKLQFKNIHVTVSFSERSAVSRSPESSNFQFQKSDIFHGQRTKFWKFFSTNQNKLIVTRKKKTIKTVILVDKGHLWDEKASAVGHLVN